MITIWYNTRRKRYEYNRPGAAFCTTLPGIRHRARVLAATGATVVWRYYEVTK